MTAHTIRTRFSPSPTGLLHLGNARAALFSALFAKKNDGIFILRIEDTDASRSDDYFVQVLQDDLKWLGIIWQEGPGVDGAFGPYWQSQRQHVYADYYHILEEKGLIYPCFCTDQELAISRKLQLSRGQAPRYAGTCRGLSDVDKEKQLVAGKKPAWRFIIPQHEKIEFVDVVKGLQTFESDTIGDFIVRRADGTSPFLFCNAIDDALMQVSHVLRGEDHVANTPRQILILKALQLSIPQYGHLSLITGDDGAPLSKRHGSFSLHDIRNSGYLPIAILNYLSRLGHTTEIQTLLPFDELAVHFHIEKLSRSPARFDEAQLMYWQKMAVQALDVSALWHWLGDAVQESVPESKWSLFAKTVQANIAFPHEGLMWAKIFFQDHLAIDDGDLQVIRDAGEQFFVEAELAVDQHGVAFQAVLDEMKKTLGIGGKKLFMPLRAALTGKQHGPELALIAELLGQEKMKQRLSRAFQLASKKE